MVLLLRLLLNFQSLENLNTGTADPVHSKCRDMQRNPDVPFEDDEDEIEAIEEEEEGAGKHWNMFEMTHLSYLLLPRI